MAHKSINLAEKLGAFSEHWSPKKDLETLIKRLAPYEAMGTKLCLDAKAKKEN